MPDVINGKPGTRWRNSTPRVAYQLKVSGAGTCGYCYSLDGQVADYWPLPLHKNCRCISTIIYPGESAPEKFVDYGKALEKLPAAGKAKAVGPSVARLVRAKLIKWSDTVGADRVRSLAEIVGRERLTLKQLLKAGVPEGVARRAIAAAKAAAKGPHGKGIATRISDAVKRILGRFKDFFRRPRPVVTPAPAGAGAKQAGDLASKLKPKPPAIKPGAAKIVHADDGWRRVARNILGRDVTDRQMLDLAGAPSGAASITAVGPSDFVLVAVEGDGFEMTRALRRGVDGRPELVAESFRVDAGLQGQGIGADAFGRMVKQAGDLGIRRISTYAVRSPAENGYYTWPRFGYDGPIPADVLSRLPPDLAGATRVSDLMLTPEGSAWWKTNGKSVHLSFDPTPGSPSMRAWDAYRAARAAAP